MPQNGIDLARDLLNVESIVFAFFLVYAFACAWSLRFEKGTFFPSTQLGVFSVMTAVITVSLMMALRWRMEHFQLAIELSLGMALSFFHPALALSTFIVLLFLRPWELMSPPDPVLAMIPRLMGILAVMSAVIHAVVRRERMIPWGFAPFFLVAFTLWVLLSTFVAPDPSESMSAFTNVFMKSVLIFFIALGALKSERSLRVAQGSLICAGLGIATVALAKNILQGGVADRMGSFGLLADPNDISAVMIIIVPFAIYQALRVHESVASRIVSLVVFLMTVVLIYMAKSRGGVVAGVMMLATMLFLKLKDRKLAVIIAAASIVLVVPLISLLDRSSADMQDSSESRLEYWKTAGRMAMHNPILGVGFGGYPARFEQYTAQFIESGERTAHSSWFLVLGETGPLGLIFFVGIFVSVLWHAWTLRETKPEFLTSAVGYGTAMSFLSHSYTIYPYLLWGLVLAASRVSRGVA